MLPYVHLLDSQVNALTFLYMTYTYRNIYNIRFRLVHFQSHVSCQSYWSVCALSSCVALYKKQITESDSLVLEQLKTMYIVT